MPANWQGTTLFNGPAHFAFQPLRVRPYGRENSKIQKPDRLRDQEIQQNNRQKRNQD